MGVKVDCTELKKFSESIGKLNGVQRDAFMELAVKEMAGRLLALVIPRTPVGKAAQNDAGKTVHQGGTLRRGWTAKTQAQAESGGGTDTSTFLQSLSVERTARNYYRITITNPVKYASYVEYGHRQTPGRYVPAIGKRLKASWVNGQFFLQTSENDLKGAAAGILNPMLEAFLRQVF